MSSGDTSGSYWPILCVILNTSIMSLRNRLYFKVGSFKCINLSLCGILYKFIANLIAVFGFFQAL